jgi:hypothetical protein
MSAGTSTILTIFVDFLSPSNRIMGQYLEIGHDRFPSYLLKFVIHYSSHLPFDAIVKCRGLCVTYRRVPNGMIGFTDTLYTALGTTGNYSFISNLRTLQFTASNTLGFSVFTLH